MKIQNSLWVVCLLVATLFLLPQAANAQCNLPPDTPGSLAAGTYQFNVSADGLIVIEGTLISHGDGTMTTQQTLFDVLPIFLPSIVSAALSPFAPFTPSPTLPGFVPPRPQEPYYSGPTENGTYRMNCDGTFTMFVHDPFIGSSRTGLGLYEYQAVLVKGGAGFYIIGSNGTVQAIVVGAGVLI